MRYPLAILTAVITVALVAGASVRSTQLRPAASPESAVQSLFERVKLRDWRGAHQYVAPASNITHTELQRDVGGRDGSLRTYSSLSEVSTRVLRRDDSEAVVRADLRWSSAVGARHESRDLTVVREGRSWRVLWPVERVPSVPPQVIPVNYLRWDIIRRGPDEDWGAQNVEAPRVRIISMNAVERDGGVVVLGEVVNEDTVPAFVSITCTLLGGDGQALGQESSFDKISHTLLPREVSPFRIDFAGARLEQVKNVRITPNSMLVPAAADPVIGVFEQRIEKDARGLPVLRGQLVNQSGQTVNIPHVLATYYDDSGRVIWVADSYVDRALLPQTPVPFAVAVHEDIQDQVHNYRVVVNHYSLER